MKWFNLQNPKEKDVVVLKKQFGIHPIILDELLRPSDRSKVEHYDDYLFLVFHLPLYNVEERTSRRAEIDIIATKKNIISVTYENLEVITQFSRDIERKFRGDTATTAEMLYRLLEEINDFSFRQLKHVERKINFIGEQLFHRQDIKLLKEISYVKRDLLTFSTIAVTQHSTLESLLKTGTLFWGEEAKIYFSDLLGDFLKIQNLLDNLKATIESYSETLSQLFEFQTSTVLRRFTVLVFLTFPIMLYATIVLQPKIDHLLIKTPADYWFQIGAVAVLVASLAIFFRKRGWL